MRGGVGTAPAARTDGETRTKVRRSGRGGGSGEVTARAAFRPGLDDPVVSTNIRPAGPSAGVVPRFWSGQQPGCPRGRKSGGLDPIH